MKKSGRRVARAGEAGGCEEMHNALTYEFDQVQPDSAVIVLEWGEGCGAIQG